MAKTPSIGIDQNGPGLQIDKFWGRVPKMLHSIPEADIWVCNPEYIELMNMYVDGVLTEKNISAELYNELENIIDGISGGIILSTEDKRVLSCFLDTGVAPGMITDFAASGGGDDGGLAHRGFIEMTWSLETAGIPESIYELWENGIKIRTGVSPGHRLYTDSLITSTYHVIARNNVGFTTSNTDLGNALVSTNGPGNIVDLNASDNYVGSVNVTWTHNDPGFPDPAKYDLYEDGIRIERDIESPFNRIIGAGTRDYYVVATNNEGLVASNTDAGTSIKTDGAPAPIMLFNATDNLTLQLECTWLPDVTAFPAATYDLYKDNVILVSGVTSPHMIDPAPAETATYFVTATNPSGVSTSESDEGTALAILIPPVPFDLTATNDQFGLIVVDFVPPVPVNTLHTTYDIYVSGVLHEANISLPYDYRPLTSGIYTIYVIATNADGTTESISVDGEALEAPSTTILLDQFSETTSVTLWIAGKVSDGSLILDEHEDIIVVNTHDQPTLRFDGQSLTSKRTILSNTGNITGTTSGENALELGYEVELVNTSTISGAGGKGGEGGSGASGPSKTVTTTENKIAYAGQYLLFSSGQYHATGFLLNGITTDGAGVATWSLSHRDGSSGSVVSGAAGAWGAAQFAAGGQFTVSGSNIKFAANYNYTAEVACTVPGGTGGDGGDGGEGANYTNAAPTAGGAGSPGATVSACNGETSSVGYDGGVGGRGGNLGVDGRNGTDGVGRSGSGNSGEPHGFAISGSSFLFGGSILGTLVGGQS